MIASGYTMDLYCEVDGHRHGFNEGRAQFYGETWADCVAQARASGWRISKKRRECICPKCIAQGLSLAPNTKPNGGEAVRCSD